MADLAEKWSSQFRKVRARVLQAIPDWYSWPRNLRLLLVALPDVGCSDLAIQDWCERRGFKYERIQKQIEETPSFQAALNTWRTEGKFPYRNNWRNSLTKAHLQMLVAESEGFGQYLDLLDLRASGQSGKAAADVSKYMGWDEAGDPVEEQPEIKIFSGERVVGIPIGPEELAEVKEAEQATEDINSLSDWAIPDDTAVQEQVLP